MSDCPVCGVLVWPSDYDAGRLEAADGTLVTLGPLHKRCAGHVRRCEVCGGTGRHDGAEDRDACPACAGRRFTVV